MYSAAAYPIKERKEGEAMQEQTGFEMMQISLFGSFSVCWKQHYIVERVNRPNKPWELLALLLVGRLEGEDINQQLMDKLWEPDEIENPSGALKNAMYSLRRSLQLADDSIPFVVTESGSYRWNDAVPVQVDALDFQHAAEHFNGGKQPADERIALGRAALRKYGGDVLPALGARRWVASYNSYLRKLYLDTALETVRLLMERGAMEDLQDALDIANRAAQVDPLQQNVYRAIFSLMQQLDMKSTILSYYPVVSNLFYDEQGEALSTDIREIYHWASEYTNSNKADIRQIQQMLAEEPEDGEHIRGAYYCDFETFAHLYRLEARDAPRSGKVVMNLLVSVVAAPGKKLKKEDLVEGMDTLRDTLKSVLRVGDVYSRCSRNQYVLMSGMRAEADAEIVKKRIADNYMEHSAAQRTALHIVAHHISKLP